jgi:hypothetical protein
MDLGISALMFKILYFISGQNPNLEVNLDPNLVPNLQLANQSLVQTLAQDPGTELNSINNKILCPPPFFVPFKHFFLYVQNNFLSFWTANYIENKHS